MAVSFENLNVGDEISPLSVQLDQMMLWIYAGASGDFNLIHVDKEFGEKVGLGGTIAHGLSNMARMGRCVTDWVQDPGALKQLKVRFSAPARPGDTVTFKGKVTDKKEEDGKRTVVLEAWAENQDGAPILSKGVAVVEL
jgi:acyl dehydratase